MIPLLLALSVYFEPESFSVFGDSPTGYVSTVMFAFADAEQKASRVNDPSGATWRISVEKGETHQTSVMTNGNRIVCRISSSFKPDLDGQQMIANAVMSALPIPAASARMASGFGRWHLPGSAMLATEPRECRCQDGGVFRYRWHQPARPEAGRKYPLVVLLHGAGERGTDNCKQVYWGACQIVDYFRTRKEEFFLVAGQVPRGKRWVEVDWDSRDHVMPEAPSETMGRLIEFLDDLRGGTLPIDLDRIYVTGVSMGGYGTWDLICRKTEWFAAAMPICGGGDWRQAQKLVNLPIFIHHGDEDDAVPVYRSRTMYAALLKAGANNVRYTEYPGCSHFSWGPAYRESKNFDWLFSHRRHADLNWIAANVSGERIELEMPDLRFEIAFDATPAGGKTQHVVFHKSNGFPIFIVDGVSVSRTDFYAVNYFKKMMLRKAENGCAFTFSNIRYRALPADVR